MSDGRISANNLRSARWFAANDLRGSGHRGRAGQMGYSPQEYRGKPVIGIVNTWSDISPCHQHFKTRVDDVKRGVLQAGGFPIELPAISLSEPFQKPSTMMYRNLLALETEELLRSYPVDGVVLMGGCDKTVPALLMGAISMDLPTIFVCAGPMIRGHYRGKTMGSGSDSWKYWADRRAGLISEDEWETIQQSINRSPGTCMTMGTASTMSALTETLGLTLPGFSSVPAVDSQHIRLCSESGRTIVEATWLDRKPSTILSREGYLDAVTALMALGGSTNAVIHLIAMASRSGIDLSLDDFNDIAEKTPVIANIQPIGSYLMDDFYASGGILAALNRISGMLHTDRPTINGKTVMDNISGAAVFNDDVVKTLEEPVEDRGGLVVLRGNLAPEGAVIKPHAAEAHLREHVGPALVFDSYDEMNEAVNRDDLDVSADTILVLRNVGPVGGPGMPEWGMLPLPKRLLAAGVRDMVRISDARMSGTSYGACVLHVSPESYVGGPLAIVQNGDRIKLSVASRELNLLVSEEEIAERRAKWTAPSPRFARGYGAIYSNQVTQAHQGCDFAFLERGPATPEPEIH